MKSGRCLYVGAVLVALVVGLGLWKPLQVNADHHGDQVPKFRVDPFWPKILPAPVGYNPLTWPTATPGDNVAHRWVTGEVAGSCTDADGNVYTFNRGWEIGVTVNGVLQGNQSGAIVGQDSSASAKPSPPVVAAGWRSGMTNDKTPEPRAPGSCLSVASTTLSPCAQCLMRAEGLSTLILALPFVSPSRAPSGAAAPRERGTVPIRLREERRGLSFPAPSA